MKADFRPLKVEGMRYHGFDSPGVQITVTLDDKSTFDLFVSNESDYHLKFRDPKLPNDTELDDGRVYS